jgi:hypothetical protein
MFTLQHPTAPPGLTVPTTITTAAIFELFDYHDAILKLKDATKELQPEPFAWDKFTKFWNFHATEDGPRFVTWEVDTGLYLQPLKVVTLTDFGLSRRIPKVDPGAAKPPKVEVKPSQDTHLPSSVSSTTVSSSNSSNAIASGSPSLVDFLPAEITGGLVATGLATWIRQEAKKTEYFKRRDLEHKAKVSATRNEKKKTKKKGKKNSTTTSEDVTMSDPASTSKALGA